MPLLETLEALVKPWAVLYSDSKPTEAVVLFAHVAGTLWGGGLAIAADRSVWKLRTAAADERLRLLGEIDRLHASVLIGLSLAAISGVLLTTADLKTFGTSPYWWGKMIAFALLLTNGWWLQHQERRFRAAPATMDGKWQGLRIASAFSFTLWFTVALGGVFLVTLI